MSLTVAIATGLVMGIVFGFALETSVVFEPGVIVGQMQMRNFIMLKVFLTAVATGAVVLAALNGFGIVKLAPKAAMYYADVIGGLILGAGIALAGACPGTTLAQIGAGYRDATRAAFIAASACKKRSWKSVEQQLQIVHPGLSALPVACKEPQLAGGIEHVARGGMVHRVAV